MAAPKPLSRVLPPLILGTATFNTQYHDDPSHMPCTAIVRRALELDVAAFDTSPYYGPSETLLGEALRTLDPPRDSYFLITKAGRIAADEFDYSPAWLRYSICRSLDRLGTPYLDLVYLHDVEFVSPAAVVAAVAELRRLRDQGLLRYVGISGYPVDVLADLAEAVLADSGEPLDAVMSYAHFCLQNTGLGHPDLLARFRAAGVQCLLNASILGMGLLTSRGVDQGPMASWHPAPPALRSACRFLADVAAEHGERLEEVAIRWALDAWARVGAPFGTAAHPPVERDAEKPPRIGVSVMGVTAVEELNETWELWKSVAGTGSTSPDAIKKTEKVAALVRDQMWPCLGTWKDYSWKSGGEAFTNKRLVEGVIPDDDVAKRWGLVTKATPDAAATKI
ncbi:hypothetical protein CDD80_2992 [Ophiocordyceps camponoti-rufipedis]|uniref:NADP-dependent oxidoreductase domain-containing protein n=1 Tax=Ophiocordyceps camponoti-rufipedis TaxID=2004952 RepID=A0A2C5Z4D3_9HYPO|nr:hypothetical protein CDD80_2992 [Ophiocordyceps camponoti-rufipedis]